MWNLILKVDFKLNLLAEKRVLQKFGRVGPCVGRRFKTPQDEVFGFLGELSRYLRMNLVVAHFKYCCLRGAQLDKGRFAGRHLDDSAAQRPDISLEE